MAKLTVVGAEADLFSYAALSREDADAAREDAGLIKAHMRSAAESIIEVGLALQRQKERLPHGMFLPWIKAEFGMSEWTARNFMNVSALYTKSGTVPDLPPKALYAFAAPSTPPEVRDQVEALVVDGQQVTAADVRRLKLEAKGGAKVVVPGPKPQTFDEERNDLLAQVEALRAENERLKSAHSSQPATIAPAENVVAVNFAPPLDADDDDAELDAAERAINNGGFLRAAHEALIDAAIADQGGCR